VALVFGTLADKDWGPMLGTLAPLAGQRFYVAPSGASRDAIEPATMAARHPGTLSPSLPGTLDALTSSSAPASPTLVVVAGSMVLVGHARAHLLGIPRDPPVAL
jgi:folylpolyglutamate synthase/dihydropteroate synthase